MTGRGLRGRRIAQLMLFAAIAPDLLVALLFVSAPNFMGPMVSEPPAPLWWLAAVGIAWNLAGLGLMIRIYRAAPEARSSAFRSIRG